VARLRGAAAALALVEPLAARLDGYFHFHVVRADLLQKLGDDAAARIALERAAALAPTPLEAAEIGRRLQGLAPAARP